jgi:nucleoside-diphosphate-sugar epimerase
MSKKADNNNRAFNLANTSQTRFDTVLGAVRESVQAAAPAKAVEAVDAGPESDLRLKDNPGFKAPEFVRLSTARASEVLGYAPSREGGINLFRKLLDKFSTADVSPPAVDPEIVTEPVVSRRIPLLGIRDGQAPAERVFDLDQPNINPEFVHHPEKPLVVIMGGAGFLGLNLSLQYALNGYQVAILDNFAAGLTNNLTAVVESNPVLAENIAAFSHNAALPFTFAESANVVQVHHAASLASPAFYFVDQRGTSHTGVNASEQAQRLAQKFSVLK